MYHLQNEKIVKTLWHYVKKSDSVQNPEAPLIEDFRFQSQIHEILQIVFSLRGRRKTSNWLREHQQITFVTLSGFWLLRGLGCLSESVKKGKFLTKIFLLIMLNEVLKSCEK